MSGAGRDPRCDWPLEAVSLYLIATSTHLAAGGGWEASVEDGALSISIFSILYSLYSHTVHLDISIFAGVELPLAPATMKLGIIDPCSSGAPYVLVNGIALTMYRLVHAWRCPSPLPPICTLAWNIPQSAALQTMCRFIYNPPGIPPQPYFMDISQSCVINPSRLFLDDTLHIEPFVVR